MSVVKNSYQFYKELPTWAKGVIAVGGLAILYFAGKSIFDRIKKDASTKDAQQVVADSKKDLQTLLNSGMKLSYPVSNYSVFSSTLITAFNGYGTAETLIYGVFQAMKNEADVLQLIISFGLRTIKGGCFLGFCQDDVYKIDLPGAIANEMLKPEKDKINGILKNNNVDYQF